MDWSSDDRQIIGEISPHTLAALESTASSTSNQTKTLCQKIEHLYVTTGMFDPRNPWRIRWDVFLMFFIVVNAVCVPIDLAVNLETTIGLSVINNIADTFFLIDILVSFRTGYIVKQYGNDFLHNKPVDVGCTYLKGWFIVDVLGVGVSNIYSQPMLQYNIRM